MQKLLSSLQLSDIALHPNSLIGSSSNVVMKGELNNFPVAVKVIKPLVWDKSAINKLLAAIKYVE